MVELWSRHSKISCLGRARSSIVFVVEAVENYHVWVEQSRAIFLMSTVEKNFGEVVHIFFLFEHGPNNICVGRAHFFYLTLPKHILFGPNMVEHICFGRARSTQTELRFRQSKHNDFWSRRSTHKVSTLTRASLKTC